MRGLPDADAERADRPARLRLEPQREDDLLAGSQAHLHLSRSVEKISNQLRPSER